ncbi:MAG: hypothetical protein AAGN35_00660 [Bacteroidota bacterium]
MTAHLASLINAIVLIGLGLWGYLGSDNPSMTALIPVGFGVAIAAMYPGIKSQNKIIAHVAVLLTLVLLIALFMPLRSALGRDDTMAVVRIVIMLATTAFSMVFFIRAFIAARKARAEG